MAEYIERITAISVACKGCNKEFPNEPCEPAECHIQQGLFAIPAADVAEVRHGEWEDVGDDISDLCFRCSLCKEEYSCEINMKTFANYCPNCGAKMDGKGEHRD